MKKAFLLIVGFLAVLVRIDSVNAWVSDYNDTYNQAQNVTLNEWINSDANDQSDGDTGFDIDFWKIVVPKDGYIWVTLNQPSKLASYHVYLSNSSHREFYDMWTDIDNEINIKSPVIGVKAGTYYLEIDGFQPGNVDNSPYTFLVSYGNNGFWEKEQNLRLRNGGFSWNGSMHIFSPK